MTRDCKLAMIILPILLVAGCTMPDIFPGQDVIKIAPTTQEEGYRDVLVIKEISTIPKSPILAGQTVLLSFIIENRDKEKETTEVAVDLFDAPLLKDKDGKPCNTVKCTPIGNECTGSKKCSILPGEQKQITFELLAPDDKEIAGLETVIDISFRVTYRFYGSTLFKLVVVNLDEIKARQRADSPITLDMREVFGSGPVKIDAELKGAPYILSGLSGTIAFTVKSVGDTSKGGIKDSKIPQMIIENWPNGPGLSIRFPGELSGIKDVEGKKVPESLMLPSVFRCSVGKDVHCGNIEDAITLFKGESSPLLFQIRPAPAITTPFKSYDVQASLNYTYELRDSKKVTIQPLGKIR